VGVIAKKTITSFDPLAYTSVDPIIDPHVWNWGHTFSVVNSERVRPSSPFQSNKGNVDALNLSLILFPVPNLNAYAKYRKMKEANKDVLHCVDGIHRHKKKLMLIGYLFILPIDCSS
jgi:hypothetical protein